MERAAKEGEKGKKKSKCEYKDEENNAVMIADI